MADTFGELAIPVPAPATGEPVADPCLVILLGYLKAFFNVYCLDAWQAVAPGTLPVNQILTTDPTKYVFNERDLPALYLNRPGQVQPPLWWAADWLVAEDSLKLLWVFPPAPQDKQNLRSTFINGLVKALLVAIERERDPSFVVTGDPDPTAATLVPLPTAIKLSVATSTSTQTYSGAALNGAIGVGAISPPRAVTVTAAGPSGNFAVGSKVVVTSKNLLGFTTTATLTITGPGTFSTPISATSVVSVAIEAQAGTGGTFTIGVGPYSGRGSVIRNFCGLMALFVAKWAATTMTVSMADAPSRTYEALAVDLTIREKLAEDLGNTSRYAPQTSIDISYLLADGSVSEEQSLPDNSGA